MPRRGSATIPCIDEFQHDWPHAFDADNWQRCVRGCGCGRPRLGRFAGGIYEPREVPGSTVAQQQLYARQTRSEPILCVSSDGRHQWTEAPDIDGWWRCTREGCNGGKTRAHKPVAPAPPRPAGPPLPPSTPKLPKGIESPLPVMRVHAVRTRHVQSVTSERCTGVRGNGCGKRLFAERDSDGDVTFFCVSGHRHYPRAVFDALAIELEIDNARIRSDGHRNRRPSIAGLWLD